MYADWEIKCNKRKTEPWPESETTVYVQWFEWAEKTTLKLKYFIKWHDTSMMYFLHILLSGLYLCSDSDTSGTTVKVSNTTEVRGELVLTPKGYWHLLAGLCHTFTESWALLLKIKYQQQPACVTFVFMCNNDHQHIHVIYDRHFW